MLAYLRDGDLSVLGYFLAFVCLCVAIWRATLSDVLGCLLALLVAIVVAVLLI